MTYIDPVLEPDSVAFSHGVVGWVSHERASTRTEAIQYVRDHADFDVPSSLRAVDVLMRLQSEVEARINGGDEDGDPQWVQCTKRARHPVPYWRIEAVA